jgi:ABC-type branched-subunit amino acid transport system substrate-binding protein
LKKVAVDDNPVAIVGPVYSNVGMGLKGWVNKTEIPMISIFATHNDLTKNSNYVFRICASNRRLVKTMAEYLIPEVQKHHLNIISFKDLSDDYSTDLADTFRIYISGVKTNYNEVLFKGVAGIERLRDLNSKVWSPTKSDVLFMPTRDIVAAHILSAMESEPYLVAAIDTVDFLHLMKRVKSQKTHIRLVTTSQWLPQKSDYSKKVEKDFEDHFGRKMSIMSALTYDATYTAVAAYHRSQTKGTTLVQALRDGTKIRGVTGVIYIGHDGERVFSDQFLKEEIIE